jgi:uncharacterized membrane protein YraQ (UPF0718 family)
MGIPDGAHTHGGGSGPGELVVILLAVALLGPAVAAAVAELLHLLVIVIMVLAALRAACLAGLLVLRARRRLESAALAVAPNLGAVSPLHRTERAASPLPRAQGPPVPPIESGREVSGGVSSSRPRRECGGRRRPPRLGPAATRCKPARAAARPMTPAARGGPRSPGGAAGSPRSRGKSSEPRGRVTMHENPRRHTGHRMRAKRWRLALLYSAGMLLLALGAAVIVIGAYLVGASGR